MYAGFQGEAVVPQKPYVAAAEEQHAGAPSVPCFGHVQAALRADSAASIRSSFQWASLEWPFMQSATESDGYSRSADLSGVSWADGKLHVWGLTPAQMAALVLPDWMPFYKMFTGGQQRFPAMASQVQFHPEPMALASCAEWVDESTFFLAPWVSDNFFHMHNDNLFPSGAHIDRSSAQRARHRSSLRAPC